MRDVCGQVLDSSRDLGMTVENGVGWRRGKCDGLAVLGHPPLDPSTWLRVSGPTQGNHEEPVSKVTPRPNSRFLATRIRAYGTRRIGQEYPIGLCLTDF